MERHFRFSSFREKLIEHLFVGEMLKASWQSGDCSLESGEATKLITRKV